MGDPRGPNTVRSNTMLRTAMKREKMWTATMYRLVLGNRPHLAHRLISDQSLSRHRVPGCVVEHRWNDPTLSPRRRTELYPVRSYFLPCCRSTDRAPERRGPRYRVEPCRSATSLPRYLPDLSPDRPAHRPPSVKQDGPLRQIVRSESLPTLTEAAVSLRGWYKADDPRRLPRPPMPPQVARRRPLVSRATTSASSDLSVMANHDMTSLVEHLEPLWDRMLEQ